MKINQERISENIELSSLTTDKFKISLISFSKVLTLSKEALAYNSIIANLMHRGTYSLPSVALLNKKLDELYGAYLGIKSQRCGENILFTVTAEILDGKYIPDGTDLLQEISSLLAELLYSPAFMREDFSSSAFEQEKKLIIDSVRSEKNNPRLYTAKRCLELIHAEAPEIPTGDEFIELITNADFDSLKEYYRLLIGSSQLNVFYIGSAEQEKVAKEVTDAFSEYPSSYTPSVTVPSPVSKTSPCAKRENIAISQGNLALAFCTGVNFFKTPDSYYAMLVLNEIFGGGPSSKLFINVRERQSLCYSCFSSFHSFSGILIASAAFNSKNYETVKAEILNQLNEIKNHVISETELENAKKSLLYSYRQLSDSPSDIRAFFQTKAIFGVKEDIELTIRKISEVTANEVCALAKNITLDAEFFVEGAAEGANEEDFNDD